MCFLMWSQTNFDAITKRANCVGTIKCNPLCCKGVWQSVAAQSSFKSNSFTHFFFTSHFIANFVHSIYVHEAAAAARESESGECKCATRKSIWTIGLKHDTRIIKSNRWMSTYMLGSAFAKNGVVIVYAYKHVYGIVLCVCAARKNIYRIKRKTWMESYWFFLVYMKLNCGSAAWNIQKPQHLHLTHG